MYESASAVWMGLAKNATEGLGSPRRIVPVTVLLLMGQVLPVIAAVLWVAFWVSSRVVGATFDDRTGGDGGECAAGGCGGGELFAAGDCGAEVSAAVDVGGAASGGDFDVAGGAVVCAGAAGVWEAGGVAGASLCEWDG